MIIFLLNAFQFINAIYLFFSILFIYHFFYNHFRNCFINVYVQFFPEINQLQRMKSLIWQQIFLIFFIMTLNYPERNQDL